MLAALKIRLQNEAFIPTALSVVISPVHIIRNGLYKSIFKVAPLLRGDILDFGCGSKPYEKLFANAEKYIGVDIEVSGHNHQNSKVDIFYDGKTLPFPDKHFDAVVSFEVFEHIFNLEAVLKELNRVLKEDGKLLVTIPFAWDEHEVPYDFARYTSYGIAHILRQAGFEIVELQKTTTYFLAISQMLIYYFAQYVLPKGRILGRLSQVLILFPLNLLALIFNAILPKRYEYFCNSLVFAKKCSS